MSQDSEKVKRLVAFKERVSRRVEELDTELQDQKAMLEIVNSILLEKGFKRAEMTKGPVETEAFPEKEEIAVQSDSSPIESTTQTESVIPLRAASGELLAILHATENSIRVLPAGDKDFSTNTPPFTHFLVERVLMKMQERDNELVRARELDPNRILSYQIINEGDIIREIMIKNVDAERLRELKSSIRWTLEKMFEKLKGQV